MSQGRPGHSLFAGAKISLGPVNLTGKSYDDYKPAEIAFIVGRYMIHNSEDGKTYNGGVPHIVEKMWPDRWPPGSFTDSTDSKRVYFWLKNYGFYNKHGFRQSTWFLPGDLDDNYAKTSLLKGTTDPKNAPIAPVTIKCVCGAGPFENQEVFASHRSQAHAIEREEIKEEIVEQQQLPVAEAPPVQAVACPVCGNAISKDGMKGHLYAAHRKEQCKKCGALVAIGGMGGHVRVHKIPKVQKALLEIIRELGDGQAPRVYQKVLDERLGTKRTDNGRISHLSRGLVSRGYLRVEGKTVATRWYLTAKGRGKGGNGTKAVAPVPTQAKKPKKASTPKQKLPEAVAEKPQPTLNGIPGAKEAQVFEMADGRFILVMNGKTYFVTQMSELVS